MYYKIIFLILFFPLASVANTDYTGIVNKIGEALYKNSQWEKDINAGLNNIKYQTPDYIRQPMEIILPTAMGLIEKKFELRYVKEF